jgi:catechol 2,3-dioxygenase-like lactoylglutathione lyase family enzyme
MAISVMLESFRLLLQAHGKGRSMKCPSFYRTIQVDGFSIFYREAGPKDGPTLLLLHGLPSSSRMFEPLFARLSYCRLVTINIVSGRPGCEYHPSDMAITMNSLDHLVLTVANIDITVDFYTEVLGMELFTVDGRKALAFGEQMIKLQQRGHEVNPKAAHPTAGASDICFLTSTPLDEVIHHLNEQRVHIEEGPVERNGAMGKMRSIYVRDPDKNLVEISNY